MTDKSTYVSPVLEMIGSFEELTMGNSSGATLDFDFPVGTPDGELTLS
ncbi:lasso RiPP family leader peptide-containing protein [Croceicoccus hydrothermalis]|nr:lasso RiPP family leader peptide-containing protein [Croceicoccus hydrothermalis]